jgi:4-amino-4-deoxy-L-arabinose transferase-like glycosyltransferase
VIGFIFRWAFLGEMNLFVDEAYYWDWSRHLSFGYFSHPPMVAWLIWLGRLLFGDTEFAVRIPFVILGTATILAAYSLGKTFFNQKQKVGLLLALLVSLSPSYILPARMATPDQPVVFFWILSMIFFWKAYKEARIKDWILLGIFLGLGFLSKYQIFFLSLAILAFLIFGKRGRGILKTSVPYLSFGIAGLIFLPNILWNARHEWITFIFQLLYGIERSFGQNFLPSNIFGNILVFFKELIAAPDIILKLAVFLSLPVFFWFGIKQKKEEFVFLFASFIFITAFFSIFFGKSHWFFPGAIGAYLMSTAFVVTFYRNKLSGVIVSGFILFFLWVNVLGSGNLIYNLAFEKELRPHFAKIGVYSQVFGDSHSWKETVGKVASELNYRKSKGTLVAQYYTIASELAFYLPYHPRTYSPNGQYLIWGPPLTNTEDIIMIAYNPEFSGLSIDNTKNVVEINQGSRKLYLINISSSDWKRLNLDWGLKLKGP